MKHFRKILISVAAILFIGVIFSVLSFATETYTPTTTSYNFDSATTGYSFSYSATSGQPDSTKIGGITSAMRNRYGELYVRTAASGNKYITYKETAAKGTASNLTNITFKHGGSLTEGNLLLNQNDYYVYDLDMMSETGIYPALTFNLYGQYKDSSGAATNFTPSSAKQLKIKNDGSASYIELNGAITYLPSEPGKWFHITYIIETADTPSESKIHVYIDGNYLGTVDNAFTDLAKASTTYYNGDPGNSTILETRVEPVYSGDVTASFSFDNIVSRIFEKDYTGDSETGIAAFLENPQRSITSCSDSIFTEDYKYPLENPIATVNDIPYDDFDNAFAAATASTNSTLKLMSDVRLDCALTVPGNAKFIFDLNGYNLITESANEKPSTFNVSEGATLTLNSSRPGAKIFNISYEDTTPGGAAIIYCGAPEATVSIDGENLSTYSASLIDVAGAANNTTEITVTDGHYYATVNDSYAFIMNRVASAAISVNDCVISLPSGAFLYSTDSSYINGQGLAEFSGCTIISEKIDTPVVNQIDSASTLSFENCNIYGSLIPNSQSNANGTITVDSETRFAGIPAFNVPAGYKFAGVIAENVNLTLYYNEFFEADNESTPDSFIPYEVSVNINFQTALVPTSTETAMVRWLSPDGQLLYSEEYSVGSVASYKGEPLQFEGNNGWYDYRVSGWGESTQITEAGKTYSFYPTLAPIASIDALQNITLYTGFDMHLYLPAPASTVNLISVTDKNGTLLDCDGTRLIDGLPYSIYTLSPGASSLEKDLIFRVTYTVTDEQADIEETTVTCEINLNVAKYAEKVLAGNYTENEKKLCADMLRYAYECYKLVNDQKNIAKFHKLLDTYSEYLSEIPDNLGTSQNYSNLEKYISSVHFRLGSEVDYVFEVTSYFKEGMTINLSWCSISGEIITQTFEYDGSTAYATDGIKIYDISSIVRITVDDADGAKLAKGYYSLPTYMNAVGDEGITSFAKALMVFSSTAQKYKYPAARKDTISYSDFGAAGDGITDDFFAIKSTHDFANRNGIKVKTDPTKTYLIKETYGENIVIQTDTDWTDTKFVIDDRYITSASDNDTERLGGIFLIASDYTPVEYYPSSAGKPGETITAINDAAKNGIALKLGDIPTIDLGLGYPAMLTIYNETCNQYIRYGGNANDGNPQHEIVMVDENGIGSADTAILHDFTEITKIVAIRIDDNPITITGGEFTTRANQCTASYSYFERGFVISRPNTTFNGLEHYITDEGDDGNPYRGFINTKNTCNILYENCILTGHRVYDGPASGGGTTPQGTYDISNGESCNITWRNVTQSNFFHLDQDGKPTSTVSIVELDGTQYWGIMGSSYCKNLTYDNCKLTRFDAHCGFYNATIKDSEVAVVAVIGGGNLEITNTKIYHGATDSNSVIGLRYDYGSTFSGDVTLKDVTFVPYPRNSSNGDYKANGTYIRVNIFEAYWYNHNFGYKTYLPQNITIDNFVVESPVAVTDIRVLHFETERSTAFNNVKNYISSEYLDDAKTTINLNPVEPIKTITIRNNNKGYNYLHPNEYGAAFYNTIMTEE